MTLILIYCQQKICDAHYIYRKIYQFVVYILLIQSWCTVVVVNACTLKNIITSYSISRCIKTSYIVLLMARNHAEVLGDEWNITEREDGEFWMYHDLQASQAILDVSSQTWLKNYDITLYTGILLSGQSLLACNCDSRNMCMSDEWFSTLWWYMY